MPYIKIWIHCVWNTKSKHPFLQKDNKFKILEHIKEYSKTKNIFIDCINGSFEHVHCLISLGVDQSISKIMNLLKGESSHWINNQKLFKRYFEWQDDYFAVSVSESILPKVRNYIYGQEEHHKKVTFKNELDLFIKKYGFKYLG